MPSYKLYRRPDSTDIATVTQAVEQPDNITASTTLEAAAKHSLVLFCVPTAATRETLQMHFGAATLQKNPKEYLQKDFAALMETMALAAGMKLTSENKQVPTGLES